MGCGTSSIHDRSPHRRHFQYPLRAYGVWNTNTDALTFLVHVFQYPLRAYGVWNMRTSARASSRLNFQYPLRAYGVWNRDTPRGDGYGRSLSVPSAGLWGVEPSRQQRPARWNWPFSTLCGPMGCGTRERER